MSFDLRRIGQLIKEAREGRGLNLEEVSEALCLRKRVLGAIEAGDWDNLPHPVYVKAYVTQYASLVGMGDLPEFVAATAEDDPQAPRVDDSKKDGIFARWRLRKKKTPASRPVNAPWSVIDQL
jgi:cytoskeletal protein RodZ